MGEIKDNTDASYKVFCKKHMTHLPNETKQLKTLLILLITGILSLLIL